MKITKVKPLYKEDSSPLIVENYHPVALLLSFKKILDKFVDDELLDFLTNFNLIDSLQWLSEGKINCRYSEPCDLQNSIWS